MTDFSNWPENPYRNYGGVNGHKICLMHDNQPYMVKIFHPDVPEDKPAGAYSEYISCHIYKMLGIPAQETILGHYSSDGINFLAVACKDFCKPADHLLEFSMIRNGIVSSSNSGENRYLEPILLSIQEQTMVPVETLEQRFWDMVVVDSLIGNFDRHVGNFGIIANELTQTRKLAPVYDCGSSLYPAANEETIRVILNSREKQLQRIYEFPRSAYLNQQNQKIKYLDLLQYPACAPSLKRLYPRIDMDKIQEFIQNIPELSSIRKEFYIHMLSLRKKLLLEYAYTYLPSKENTSENSPSVAQLADEVHQRENFSQIFEKNSCRERYQKLMKDLLKEYIHPKKHIRDSRVDAHAAAILLREGNYSREDIQDAIQAVSPNAPLYPDYPKKILLLAKEKKNRDFAENYRPKNNNKEHT